MGTVNFRKRAGQNTVEYLLMLAVIVGAVLIAGMALKKYMPSLFSQVSDQITNAVHQMGSTGGNRD